MTGASGHGDAPGGASPPARALDLAGRHGAELHHLATMLTGDATSATALVARTLLAAADDGDSAERLQATLVRTYLRTAPRRTERPEPGRPRDAGDLLRTLRPRARAAAALRLVQAWEPAAVAPALRARPARVDALVPTTPGLGDALAAVADQHALAGPQLDRELADELRAAAPATGRRDGRRWPWLAAAAVPLGVAVGWALATGGTDGGTVDDPSAVTAAPDRGPRTDLTPAGWELTDDGDPPRGAMGLSLATTASVEAGDPSTRVSWTAQPGSWASFAVLWCDMPPAEDANLAVPAGTLTVGAADVDLPCAGRDGSPPVTEVVPLPPGGTGTLEVAGDLPPDGGATLAVYHEGDAISAPLPRGSLTDPPAVRGDSVLLDRGDPVPGPDDGLGLRVWGAAAVEVGHDSAVRVWAGRTGAVAMTVDGVPITDDGDVAGVGAWLAAGGGQDGSEPRIDWRTQQPDLRWGRWLAYVPGDVRTFELPDAVRPAPGERATVSVEVVSENMDEHVQVVVLDAAAAEVDTAPVEAIPEPEAPPYLLGYRLVGAWTVPQDGQRRELLGAEDAGGELLALGTWTDERPRSLFLGQGYVARDEFVAQVRYGTDVADAVESLGPVARGTDYWTTLPPGHGPLSATAPAAPGQPDSVLLLYTPVPYEEFDFAAAPPPPGSWPAGSEPPPDSEFVGVQAVAEIGPDDLEDGRARVELEQESHFAARVTTEGKGRMRFVIERDGQRWAAGDGDWWSSWTAEPVTSEVSISYSGGWPPADTLLLEVEGYDDFAVEVLVPDG